MKKSFFSILFALILCSGTSAAAEQIKLLSDNALVPSDYAIYDDMGDSIVKFPTGADYSWTSDSDSELTSTDSENNGREMTGGYINNHSGKYVANSKWDSAAPSTAVFDLKDIYVVNRVDVWSSSTGAQQLGEISISVSRDGVNYTDVGKWQAEVPPAELIEQDSYGQANSHTICKFRDLNARYVKVSGGRAKKTALGKSCHQYIFGEILIMGGENYEPQPSVKKLSFIDNDTDKIYTFSGNGIYTCEATVCDTDAALITAYYSNEGRLKGISFEKGRYEHFNKSYKIKNDIVIENWESGDYLKTFVVESLEDISPLGKSEILKSVDTTQTGLLSSNTPRTQDMLVYPVSEGYTWVTAGSKASGSAFINKENQLFDGNISNAVSMETENEAYANIQIHLKDVMQIERVTVYTKCSKESYMSDYDIYASIDGVNYEYVMTKQNTVSANINRIMPVTANIDGVLYASDIRVTMKKAEGKNRLEIAETEVYGKPPQFKKERIADYSYEQEVPFKTQADIVEADSMNTLLSDGDIDTSVTSAGDYVSIIYDAKEFYQPEDIEIQGRHAGCEFLTSPDGVNYFTAGFYPCEDGVTRVYGRANNNARYVKLVFRKGDFENIELSEIKVYARRLYDKNEEKNSRPEAVLVKAVLKPNNILYLDWTGYNQSKNNVTSYKVFIEETTFASANGKIIKQVYCGGNPNLVSIVEEQFCTYAGLEPDKDYYIAVVPITEVTTNNNVTPVKIHTYSATGGEKLSGIFCINEYPYGGGAHVSHTPENSQTTEEENLKIKLKLINDMEILSKTRYWEDSDSIFNIYLSRGFGFHQYVRSEQNVKFCNEHGIYTFCTSNEPDLDKRYAENPQLYVDATKKNYEIKQKVNAKNLLGEATICGTDKLSFLEALYQADPNYGKYYDLCDVHAYCKAFEGKGNLEDNLSQSSEAYSVPEHLFTKVEKINEVLNKYNDGGKDLIFTETGWSTHTVPYYKEVIAESVTREQQANFTARCYLISAMLGVKNVFLYAFQDESWETTNKEYQFGIVDWYGNPKPAYYTYYTLGKLLKEAEFVKRLDNLEHPDYGAVFYDGEKNMYLTALWNAGGNGNKVIVDSGETQLLKVDAYGESEYIRSGEELAIGSAPVYIYSKDFLKISAYE